jgi:hypothetical protein
MGSAGCLVVVDVRQGDGSDLDAVAEIYRPLPGETIWFSWDGLNRLSSTVAAKPGFRELADGPTERLCA